MAEVVVMSFAMVGVFVVAWVLIIVCEEALNKRRDVDDE